MTSFQTSRGGVALVVALIACGGKTTAADRDAFAELDVRDTLVTDVITYTPRDASVVKAAVPSCRTGLIGANKECGLGRDDDCCASPAVAAGVYWRFFDGRDFTTRWPATLSGFRLDRYEVTVGRFRNFVAAYRGPPPTGVGARATIAAAGWSSKWPIAATSEGLAAALAAAPCDGARTWREDPSPADIMPMNCITWFEALAFCAWDDALLPTATEINYAAAGGGEQRVFPWSSPPVSDAVTEANAVFSADIAMPTPIAFGGSKPAGITRWGQHDMAGNVYEMTLDLYNAKLSSDCRDCATANDSPTDPRTILGGAHLSLSGDLRNGHRQPWAPSTRAEQVGFRCARRP